MKLVTSSAASRAVQGVYVLFDRETLAPAALLDGIGLTDVRTSAVSALAVRHLAAPTPRRLVVFGTGPQARAHVRALRATAPLEHVALVGRDRGPDGGARARARRGAGDRGRRGGGRRRSAAARPRASRCSTATPCPTEATVVAIGSHEPGAREVDERLVARATVVVESRASALREAGDVIAGDRGRRDRPEASCTGSPRSSAARSRPRPGARGCSRARAWPGRTSSSPPPCTPAA